MAKFLHRAHQGSSSSLIPLAGSSNLVTHENAPPLAPIMLKYDYHSLINGPDSAHPVVLGEALQIIMNSFDIMKSLSPETKFEVTPAKGYAYRIYTTETWTIQKKAKILSGKLLQLDSGGGFKPVLSFEKGKMQDRIRRSGNGSRVYQGPEACGAIGKLEEVLGRLAHQGVRRWGALVLFEGAQGLTRIA
ncbi:hypothetical protein C8J55DRAFT_490962 [Lentinula edodes]|uniref:Uncharacterized protein n=1 Tax=Lentinula lateritia TaxID=40482 RepID=A0A9W9A4S1_9AGAR|nr:hypothetical protein C8J55DRAFT_490962 [Lentinula edodes]